MNQTCQQCQKKYKTHVGEIKRTACEECEEKNEMRSILDETISKIACSLNRVNAARFRAMSREDQEVFAMAAWDDKVIEWRITRSGQRNLKTT